MSKYGAYLDLNAIRSIAQGKNGEYEDYINQFVTTLNEHLKNYSNINVYVFSDSAYITSNNLNIVKYLASVRNQLINYDIYFSCSLQEGNFEIKKLESSEDTLIHGFCLSSVSNVFLYLN